MEAQDANMVRYTRLLCVVRASDVHRLGYRIGYPLQKKTCIRKNIASASFSITECGKDAEFVLHATTPSFAKQNSIKNEVYG